MDCTKVANPAAGGNKRCGTAAMSISVVPFAPRGTGAETGMEVRK